MSILGSPGISVWPLLSGLSKPKCLVRLPSGPDGTESAGLKYLEPGANGYLDVRLDDCPGRTSGPCTIGVSGSANFRVTPDDKWSL